MNYITVLYLRFLLCLPVLLRHEDTDLLNKHYHDYKQGKNFFCKSCLFTSFRNLHKKARDERVSRAVEFDVLY